MRRPEAFLRVVLAAAVVIVGLGTGSASTAVADPFADALAAYDAGDYGETVRIWSALAADGDPLAQLALAGLYNSGEGVGRDPSEAARLYRLAAEQGNVDAQLNLGRLYATGEGVAGDPIEAYAWLSLAAEQGRSYADRRRQQLAEDMTAAQLAEARQRVEHLRP